MTFLLRFANLVKIDQSMDFAEKAKYFENLYKLNVRKIPWLLKKAQYDIIARWYCMVIREMVLLEDFENDPKWISGKLGGVVSETEAKEALKVLISNELLKKDGSKLVQAHEADRQGQKNND